MPALPNQDGGESLARIEELPEGTELEIVSIDPPGRTSKQGYEFVKCEASDGTRYITLATGVRNKLKLALDLVEKGEFEFGPDDPLTCRTTRYEAHGRQCVGLA